MMLLLSLQLFITSREVAIVEASVMYTGINRRGCEERLGETRRERREVKRK